MWLPEEKQSWMLLSIVLRTFAVHPVQKLQGLINIRSMGTKAKLF